MTKDMSLLGELTLRRRASPAAPAGRERAAHRFAARKLPSLRGRQSRPSDLRDRRCLARSLPDELVRGRPSRSDCEQCALHRAHSRPRRRQQPRRPGHRQPLAANFFRPSAPNYFFVVSADGRARDACGLQRGDRAAALRTPGAISPFGDVSAQLSDGNSNYNAMNLELKRRFSNNFQFLASYTWSHSIDDSSDLQTLAQAAGQSQLPRGARRLALRSAPSLRLQRRHHLARLRGAAPAASATLLRGLHRRADPRNLFGSSLQHPDRHGHQRRPAKLERPPERRRRRHALLPPFLSRAATSGAIAASRTATPRSTCASRAPSASASASAWTSSPKASTSSIASTKPALALLRRCQRLQRARRRRALLQPPDRRLRPAPIPVRLQAKLLISGQIAKIAPRFVCNFSVPFE